MSNQNPFLERVADFILQKEEKELLQTLIVFPNQRSEIFLKNYLKQQAKIDLWLPKMLTIDELMARLSGLNLLDPLAVTLKLYEIHRTIEGDKARSLDDFLSWAPRMLNDFNEIDYYLTPAQSLFSELSNVKAIEKWNPDGKPLTVLQQQYLDFFHSLFEYYTILQRLLLADKTAYKGMAYRKAAENIEQQSESLPWQQFVFVGFNALTEAEKIVVRFLKENFQLDYLVDADRFYFDPKGSSSHEAGWFLKDVSKSLNLEIENQVGQLLLNTEKNIEIVQATKQMGQVKYAGQVLHNWLVNLGYKAENTAVVLMDENLLVPLLANVPIADDKPDGHKFHYNVTMGYPLADSPFGDFVHTWLQLLLNRSEDAGRRISIANLSLLFQNPIVDILSENNGRRFVDRLTGRNQFYETEENLLKDCQIEEIRPLLSLFIAEVDSPAVFLNRFIEFTQLFAGQDVLNQSAFVLLRNQLVVITKILKTLRIMLAGKMESVTFATLQNFFTQLIARQEISLKGEPLAGIQVMGLLETRNLDFENIIILGANEGLLPKTGFQDSFIPFDLRRAYQLPLPVTKTAIASYHFFRLLQRTNNLVMLYNSEPESFGGGEASRFILQIENELLPVNHNIKWVKKVVNSPLPDTLTDHDIVIEKTPSVIDRINELIQKGISPSALSTYINCPLQFYFKEVLRPKMPERLETSIESDTFGSVVHGVLEKIYTSFVGKTIDPAGLKTSLSNLDVLLKAEFDEKYGVHDLNHGKNLLMVQVAREYVERFVKAEIIRLKKTPIQLVGLELRLESFLKLDGKTIKIKGFVDRLDRLPDTGKLRVVDYKTGKILPGQLKIKEWDLLLSNQKYSKALQVLIYQWLYGKNHPEPHDFMAGLISLRTAQGRFMPVELPDETDRKTIEEKVEYILKQWFSSLFDPNQPFQQTTDPDHCRFCDFKTVCLR